MTGTWTSDAAEPRGRARRGVALIGAVLMTAALAGCASESGPSGDTTPPTSASATPDATPTPTGGSTPTADPDDITTWTVSETGMGPIELDAAFDEAQAAVPAWTVPEACSWTAYWNDPDGAVTAYFAEDGEQAGGVTTIDVAALTDSVAPEDAPRTPEGIGLGSTLDEVRAAYPDATEQNATIGDAMLLRVGEQGTIFFTFPSGSDVVSAVTVTSRDEPPYEVCG